MSSYLDEVEQMMEEAKCTGRRVTREMIEANIERVEYKTIELAGQKMMFCGIRMVNGYVSVGNPATCIDPTNWRDSIGKSISYDNSFSKLWGLEAYRILSEDLI